MTDLSVSDFMYTATVKLHELPLCLASQTFPSVSDLAISSRAFTTYLECVTSAKNLFTDIVDSVNENDGANFIVSAEVNPLLSGQETRSKDWGNDEMARLWIFDKSQQGQATIRAAGQAQIFCMPKQQMSLN